MLIRSIIFLIGGLVSIIFRKQLNSLKNRLFTNLNKENWVRDEPKGYTTGIIFIIISIILFIIATAS